MFYLRDDVRIAIISLAHGDVGRWLNNGVVVEDWWDIRSVASPGLISRANAPKSSTFLEMTNSQNSFIICKRSCLTKWILKRITHYEGSNFLSPQECQIYQPHLQQLVFTFTYLHPWSYHPLYYRQCEETSVILSLTTIHRPHSGVNLCYQIHHNLEAFDITSKLYCVTADNTSNHQTMGRALAGWDPQFSVTKNLIGCMAHVINLAERVSV